MSNPVIFWLSYISYIHRQIILCWQKQALQATPSCLGQTNYRMFFHVQEVENVHETLGFPARTVNEEKPSTLVSLFWNICVFLFFCFFWFENLQGYLPSVRDFHNGLCLGSRKVCRCWTCLKIQGWFESAYQSPPSLFACSSTAAIMWPLDFVQQCVAEHKWQRGRFAQSRLIWRSTIAPLKCT